MSRRCSVVGQFLENLSNIDQISFKPAKIAAKLENEHVCICFFENCNCFGEMFLQFCDWRSAKGCKSDRSHQELFNKILFLTSIQCYSLANIGFDTVENEHSKVAIVI